MHTPCFYFTSCFGEYASRGCPFAWRTTSSKAHEGLSKAQFFDALEGRVCALNRIELCFSNEEFGVTRRRWKHCVACVPLGHGIFARVCIHMFESGWLPSPSSLSPLLWQRLPRPINGQVRHHVDATRLTCMPFTWMVHVVFLVFVSSTSTSHV